MPIWVVPGSYSAGLSAILTDVHGFPRSLKMKAGMIIALNRLHSLLINSNLFIIHDFSILFDSI
jgi:hypothetical protein